jgi:hypothetical protein
VKTTWTDRIIQEPLEIGIVAGELRDLELLEMAEVVALVVQADLLQIGDDDPIAFQINRIVETLVDRRPLAPGERTVQRIERPFAFEDCQELRLAVENADSVVGEFTVGDFKVQIYQPRYVK